MMWRENILPHGWKDRFGRKDYMTKYVYIFLSKENGHMKMMQTQLIFIYCLNTPNFQGVNEVLVSSIYNLF